MLCKGICNLPFVPTQYHSSPRRRIRYDAVRTGNKEARLKSRMDVTMTKKAIAERIVAFVIVGYLFAGTYNEIDLEWADAAMHSNPGTAVSYDGIDFSSPQDAIIYKRESVRDSWFPWAGHVGMPTCYVIVAAAAACFGGLCHEIYEATFTESVVRRRYFIGLFLGPLLYGVSSFAPYVLIQVESLPTPRLTTLIAISLIGGCFAEETWRFLTTLPAKQFNRNKEG